MERENIKHFEACLYNPAGTVRDLKPTTNADLQNLAIPLLNATTPKAITKGNVEIHSGNESLHEIHSLSRQQNGLC